MVEKNGESIPKIIVFIAFGFGVLHVYVAICALYMYICTYYKRHNISKERFHAPGPLFFGGGAGVWG